MHYTSRSITSQEYKFWKTIIPYMDIIFDVGVKEDTIFYDLNHYADIHMFEPDPHWVKILKDKINKNSNFVRINDFGLGSKIETKDFHYRYGSIIKRDTPRFKDMHDSYEINIRTLDDYCEEHKVKKIDYLKIDTEGYDFEVIKGSSEMLDKIRFIQFEDFKTFYGGEKLQDIIDYFEGWNIYLIGGKPKNYLATKEKVNLTQIK